MSVRTHGKSYFILAGIGKQCHKYIFRGIENTKNGQRPKRIDKPKLYDWQRSPLRASSQHRFRFQEIWTS